MAGVEVVSDRGGQGEDALEDADGDPGPYGTHSAEPPYATGSGAGVWVAVGAAWAVGFVSNFLVAPTNTGVDVVASYAAFQSVSDWGIVGALMLWTAASVRTGWDFSRSTGVFAGRVLAGFGLPAALSLYPSVVVSHAVGQVVPVEDGFVYRDWLALPLVIAGAWPWWLP